MAIDTPAQHIYIGDGSTRVFRIPTFVIGDDYIRIEIDGVYQADRAQWDVVNNALIFIDPPSDGSQINIQVATSAEALGLLGSVTNLDIVAGISDQVVAVGNNIDSVNVVSQEIDYLKTTSDDINELVTFKNEIKTVSDNILDVNTVEDSIIFVNTVGSDLQNNFSNINDFGSISDEIVDTNIGTSNIKTVANNIDDVNSVAINIVPNLEEVLNSYDYAQSASASALTATNQADIATAQAVIATSKANEASVHEINADLYATEAQGYSSSALGYRNESEGFRNEAEGFKNTASASASTSTTQAGIATNKAIESSSSALDALASKNKANLWAEENEDVEVETGKYSAKHWALKAEGFASGLATNIGYDNSTSGLLANNVQDAIDEIESVVVKTTEDFNLDLGGI